MDYFGGVDPVNYAAKIAAMSSFRGAVNKEDASKKFAVMFYAELMKQVFENQNAGFGQNDDRGYFSGMSPINDIFIDKVAEQLMSSQGYDKLISGQVPSKGMINEKF